jgi:RNA polymerase sigma-70 factor (ECF subfamily)
MKMMRFPTVHSLVEALADGRPEGFAALYDRLGGRLLRVAGIMLRDSEAAEDAVQDLFVDLARYRHRLGRVEDLEAYVFAMLRHGVKRRLRRRRNEERHLRRLVPAAAIEGAGADAGQADDLATALAALPVEQREVIALKIDGGLTFERIGAVLNVSPNTAASRYRYALEKLRRMLE